MTAIDAVQGETVVDEIHRIDRGHARVRGVPP